MNIEDYLTEDEQNRVAKEVLTDRLRIDEKNLERIISNTAYEMVHKMVDECFGNKLEILLAEKVKKIILELNEFSVFKKPNAWNREPNHAYEILQKAIEDNKDLITEQVKEALPEQSKKMLKDNLKELVIEAVHNQLFKGDK